jgi:hypothetical protein
LEPYLKICDYLCRWQIVTIGTVDTWILKVELNGEWEECRFPSKRDALAAFAALSADYPSTLVRAMLFAPAKKLYADSREARPQTWIM